MNNKYFALSIFWLLLFLISSSKLNYDPDAVIDSSYHNTIKDGYFIVINTNSKYPYLYFRDIDNKQYTYATYNWRLQYWVNTMKGFDADQIDLTHYYTKISLSKTALNRRKPLNNTIVSETKKTNVPEDKTESETNSSNNSQTTNKQNTNNDPALNYDPDAKPDFSLNGTYMGNYKVSFNETYFYTLFFEKKSNTLKAIYNYKFHHWVRKDKDFNMTDINLKRLFTGISFEHLDRMSINEKMSNKTTQSEVNMQMHDKILNGYRLNINLEKKEIKFYKPGYPYIEHAMYDLKNNVWLHAFGDFYTEDIDFTKIFNNVTRDDVDNYNKWSTSYKHIRTVDQNVDYNYSNDPDFTDFITYARQCDVDERQINFYLKVANYEHVRERMQYYFTMHKNKRGLRPVELFLNNDPIVLTVIELVPEIKSSNDLNDFNYVPANKLKNKIKEYFENAYNKSFIIKSARCKISYEELGTIPEDMYPLTYQRNYLEKKVDSVAANNSLILYYYIDQNRARQFPKIKVSNPMGLGAGMIDFDINAIFVLHEFGHTLMLQHHFDLNRAASDPEDLNNHTSSACIMNYQFKSIRLCPLCRYALNIPL